MDDKIIIETLRNPEIDSLYADFDRVFGQGHFYGGILLDKLRQLHSREIPEEVVTILMGAEKRYLKNREAMEIRNICEGADLLADHKNAVVTPLPMYPTSIMVEGPVRDLLRNLEDERLRQGKAMLALMKEEYGDDETISPEVLRLLKENPGTMTKGLISILIWVQMAHSFRLCEELIKADEKKA